MTEKTSVAENHGVNSFDEWAAEAGPRLRQAFIARFGANEGAEATADALAFAWERWTEVQAKDNPVGYVYVVGKNRVRRRLARNRPVLLPVPEHRLPWVEPGLPDALKRLSTRQRQVVTLVHGYGWTLLEVAGLLGVSKTTVQNHAERGMAKLREGLGVDT